MLCGVVSEYCTVLYSLLLMLFVLCTVPPVKSGLTKFRTIGPKSKIPTPALLGLTFNLDTRLLFN